MEVNFDDEDEIIRKKIEKLATKFEAKLLALIKEFSVKGELQPSDELSFLDKNVYDMLKEAGIDELYSYMLMVFENITVENLNYYAGISRLKSEIARSESIKFVTDGLKANLTGQGLKSYLVNKIANTIRPLILSNADYKTTSDVLRKMLPDTITRYTTQITQDSFTQYDGAIQTTIQKRFNPTKGYYIGSLIETSRPFCIHMVDTYGDNPISTTDIKKELDKYCPNGTPSDKVVDINGKPKKLGAGMIPGTTVETFPIYRGGNRCNHKWRWIIE